MNRPNKISFGVLSVPVSLTRWLAPGVTATLALVSAGLAAVVFMGFMQDESAKLRARYGTRLVPVTNVDHRGSHRVQVASLEDLAVLAARDGKIIFNQKVADGDLFFVPDGPLTYQYSKGKEVRS